VVGPLLSFGIKVLDGFDRAFPDEDGSASHDSPVGRTDMVQTALWLMQDSDNGFPFQTVRTVPTSALYFFPSKDWWIGVAYEKVSQE
jgi:hypothetical protein